MRKEDRRWRRGVLDQSQRWFRTAAKEKRGPVTWAREIRQALGIPVEEMTEKLGMDRSAFFRMEQREDSRRLTLRALERMAEAMGCKLVYALVPKTGTLTEMGERRDWEKRLKKPDENEEHAGVLRVGGASKVETATEAVQPR